LNYFHLTRDLNYISSLILNKIDDINHREAIENF
jgi:hypothetical protein